jgi:hypothetical protein
MLKMTRAIRSTFYLKHSQVQNPDDSYEKQIYVKIKNWDPPPAPLEIEEKITSFEKELKAKQHLKAKQSNLSK